MSPEKKNIVKDAKSFWLLIMYDCPFHSVGPVYSVSETFKDHDGIENIHQWLPRFCKS